MRNLMAALAVTVAVALGAVSAISAAPDTPDVVVGYNNAPAEYICKYAAPPWPWITTRWTNFVFYGHNVVGCTYHNLAGPPNRPYLCTFYDRHTGANPWVECPTPP